MMAASSYLSPASGNLFTRSGSGSGSGSGAGRRPVLLHIPSQYSSCLRLKPLLRARQTVRAITMADSSATAFGNATGCYTSYSPVRFDPFLQLTSSSSYFDTERERRDTEEPVTPEKLDKLLRDSIGEIVRNIGEAPLLVQIFTGGRGGSWEPSMPMVRVEREASSSLESWSRIKKRWERGSRMPDGVILVEELKDEEEKGEGTRGTEEEGTAAVIPFPGDDDGRRIGRTWGLVVQGRGMECATCYILNTCRVRSSAGFCTHFCLVRAKCFGEPADVQFREAWLQAR